MSEVVTIGETMVLLTAPDQLGKIKDSSILIKGIGGAESNVAIGLSRLGHRVTWVSRVGNDPFGEEILYRLRAEGVDTEHVIVDPKHRTGLMLKQRSLLGEPTVFYFRENSAASHLKKEDIKEEVICSARILHVTGITPALSASCQETVLEAVKMAKKNGVKVSFDPNLRLKLWSIDEARRVLMPLIMYSDYFFPGLEEARLLLNNPHMDVESIIRHFLDLGIERVVLKLGHEGCVTANREETVYVEGFKVKEIDPVGAGDGFCAGYLSGVLKNLSPKECAQRGNIVGALAVTDWGDYSGYPTAYELERILHRTITITR
ncbi:sugar kinase (plasmid) [Geobacillus stearothermophilus]|nr:sugar kinase [Geobacillus stearothermophilus]